MQNVPIEAICAVSKLLDGIVLCIDHNYAASQIQPTTVHSKVQLQHHNNNVDDTIMMLGGSHTITTADGSIFQLVVKNGLCYLKQRRPTVWGMKILPCVIMTSVEPWDSSTYEYTSNTHNDINMMILARSKQAMINETSGHRRDKNRKLLYEEGPHPYQNPTTTQPIKKLEAFSTNVDTVSTTNDDKKWDISTYSS